MDMQRRYMTHNFYIYTRTIFNNNELQGDKNSAGMVTSLHLMLVPALQHTHTDLQHFSPLPTIHTYQSRVAGRISKSMVQYTA